ncbi:MAG: glycoside hydrolase family 5 protein [Kiritimatiellales bacterium]|nr:glycoside hydrolase family 5 protein [Kiritimatiellales bacterium]
MKRLLIATLLLCADAWAKPSTLTYSLGKGKPVESGHEILLVKGSPGTLSFKVENTNAAKTETLSLEIPSDQLAGQLVTFSAKVKAENVSRTDQNWMGIKVMLVLETKHGKQHPQLKFGTGSFDWTEVSETLRIPSGITKATLMLGLQQANGKVWFDQVTVKAGRPVHQGKRQQQKFIGHALPRLRGVMHGPEFDAEDVRYLAEEWQANQVRWQLNWTPMKKAEEWARDLDDYDQWLSGALADLDRAMDACEKHGLMMLVDLHCPPGGRSDGGVCRMFSEQRYQDKLIEVWARIARQCKGRKCVYAYDLINEPKEPKSGATITWRALATKAVDAIRAVDPGKPVVFEPGPQGSCAGFDQLVPLDREKVIYSFHMYKPNIFTHQGIKNAPIGPVYPGIIEGDYWDKERLREAMAPAIEFQRAYNVHMYVGEFSAIRWAPGAHRYLHDLIDLFEEYGWDWSYHAYREFNGWSVEHSANRKENKPSKIQTDREKLLRDWFNKNRKPIW